MVDGEGVDINKDDYRVRKLVFIKGFIQQLHLLIMEQNTIAIKRHVKPDITTEGE